jgi:hypothetical protein
VRMIREGAVAELDPRTLARTLTRLHHSARGTGEGEDWYQVPVSLMNVALAALQRIPELERRLRSTKAENERLREELQRGYDPAAEAISAQERRIAAQRTELERAERLEAAAREVCEVFVSRGAPGSAIDRLRATLAAAPAEEATRG